MGSAAEARMSVGVRLCSQIIDATGTSSEVVQTGGVLRSSGVNIGIISFYAKMSTSVIGDGVTDSKGARGWNTGLLLPGSSGAEVEAHEDTQLKVIQANSRVAFRTVGELFQLSEVVKIKSDSMLYAPGHYKSAPIDVFGVTE